MTGEIMNKEKIVNYIKENKGAEIADIQQKFEIPYKDVKAIIVELVAAGTLAFESGVRYAYVQKGNKVDAHRTELEQRRAEAIRKIQGEDTTVESDEEKAQAERRAYLEMRRQELIKRMQAEMDDDDDDNEEEDNDDDDEEMDEEELRFKALKLIIEKDVASVSMFQRTFPIGYIRSCKLIDWMESKGYVSKGDGSTPRKVLITKEEFDKLYSEPYLMDEDDEDGEDFDLDAKFDEYEKFLEQHFAEEDSDDEDEEDEAYDRIINRIFHSDKDESETPGSDSAERKEAVQNLVFVLDKIADKKKAPITADEIPSHPSWDNEEEFAHVVMERLERLIKSDKRMGQQGAVKKAENYLEAVRDTHDRKMVQVYERLVYEIKNTSNYLYGQLKKQFFGE